MKKNNLFCTYGIGKCRNIPKKKQNSVPSDIFVLKDASKEIYRDNLSETRFSY